MKRKSVTVPKRRRRDMPWEATQGSTSFSQEAERVSRRKTGRSP